MQSEDIRVLIVEDDSLVSEMVHGLVEDLQYRVVGKAIDGRQGVEMVENLHPDVVLMDIEMPRMDGLEATRRIYESHPTPVVILSAYENPQLLREASQTGVGAYLVKPPNLRQVERAIIIAMARFHDIMELRRINLELHARNQEIETAMAQIKTLSGLLPICSSCKKIRDDQGYWEQVEIYISKHSDADFSHGLCPDCMKTLYPDSYEKSQQRRQEILDILESGPATLVDIAAKVDLPESNTLNRLDGMVSEGQIICRHKDGQALYELPKA
jgi:YesN/AraC family two-component response regulator